MALVQLMATLGSLNSTISIKMCLKLINNEIFSLDDIAFLAYTDQCIRTPAISLPTTTTARPTTQTPAVYGSI